MKTRPLYTLIFCLMIAVICTGCAIENIVPTIISTTQVPVTAVPVPMLEEPTLEDPSEVEAAALTADDLTESISTDDGVLTARYPADWSAEARGVRLNLSNAPNLANEVGRRTFLPGELGVIVVYLSRADVAANMGLAEDFTLLDLASATSGGVPNTTSSNIEINGQEAIAQSGEIGVEDIQTDAYSITYEIDGVFVTLTTYAAPGMLNDVRGITVLLAEGLLVDASKGAS